MGISNFLYTAKCRGFAHINIYFKRELLLAIALLTRDVYK